MLKSWDPRPCKEYWIQALRPTSASVAPTLNSRLLTGRSSGIEAVYTACRKMYTHTCIREWKPVIGMEWYYEIYYDTLATFTISSVKNKFSRPLALLFLTVVNHGVYGCTCPSKSGTCLFFPHLFTDGAVVIGVYHWHLHCCTANKESITSSDIDFIKAVFLPVQWPLHIHFPFSLNQTQCKHTAIVPTWTTHSQKDNS